METEQRSVDDLAQAFVRLAIQYYDDDGYLEYGAMPYKGYERLVWTAIYLDGGPDGITFEAAVGYDESALEPFEAAPTVRGALEHALKAIAEKHEERLQRERELAGDA